MSEIQIGETVSDEQIANAAYTAGVIAERHRICDALREAGNRTSNSFAELKLRRLADEIESGRL